MMQAVEGELQEEAQQGRPALLATADGSSAGAGEAGKVAAAGEGPAMHPQQQQQQWRHHLDTADVDMKSSEAAAAGDSSRRF